jgi:integrase
MWYILYAGTKTRLGLTEDRHAEAAEEFHRFASALKAREETGVRDPERLSVKTVLAYYRTGHGDKCISATRIQAALENLDAFFANKTLISVNRAACLSYTEWRRSPGCGDSAARLDLQILRAAIRFYHAAFTLTAVPCVKPPAPAEARNGWLTRSEIARLLWAAIKMPNGRHLARFILIGLYTGTRSAAILGLRWQVDPIAGHVDLENNMLHRAGYDKPQTNKRQPTVPLSGRLRAHLARWRRLDAERGVVNVVSYNRKGLKDISKIWNAACDAAGLTPERGFRFRPVRHHLRHTTASYLAQAGVPPLEAASYVGMDLRTYISTYAHMSPDSYANATNVLGTRRLLKSAARQRTA